MLVDDHLKLPLELGLLLRVGLAVATSGKTGHVLDNHEAELITSLIKQIRLDFDLYNIISHMSLCDGQVHLHACGWS